VAKGSSKRRKSHSQEPGQDKIQTLLVTTSMPTDRSHGLCVPWGNGGGGTGPSASLGLQSNWKH
jgi:hypothetical protein